MSEKTFRAVVAAVLVGALALAAIAVILVLQPASPGPSPGASSGGTPTAEPTKTPRPTVAPPTLAPTPTPTPAPVFEPLGVTAVGSVPRGGTSDATLVLRFVESSVAAIPDAAGSLTVTLANSAGEGATLAFTGTPVIDAPGSLGVTAELLAANVLQISIVASDTFNIEPITVTGLAISASSSAALGPIDATVGAFTGSLAGGMVSPVAGSPGTVVANP